MIDLQVIRYKNFLSTGNSFIEISLNTHNHTLLVGKNGMGKSSLADAICFALFNRPFRKVNKPNLVNSINNRDCVVECELRIDEHQYMIRRGIKPNIFELYRNGELINQDASVCDYQEYLETNILKTNFKTFTQIAVLGSSSFVPFMQLVANDRRSIIEDLLDIEVFSVMNTLLKDRLATNKEALSTTKFKLDSLIEKADIQRKHVASLSENHDNQLVALRKERLDHALVYEQNQRHIHDAESQKQQLMNSCEDKTVIQKKLTGFHKLDAQIHNALSKQQKSLQFFEQHDHCPTCQQLIEETFRHDQIHECRKKITESEEGIQKLSTKIHDIDSVMSQIESVEESVRQLQTSIATWNHSNKEIQARMVKLDEMILRLSEHTTSTQTEQQQLLEFETQIHTLQSQKQTLLEDKSYLDAAGLLLKDSGIKTKIIQQYLPIINTIVNKYLSALDFSVNFVLDDSFNEVIKSRYRDEFQYASFSEGEKQRIDMALLLTWRAVAKLKNSMNVNILMLDEVFDSSLDAAGADELLKILTVLEDTNVFVISHRGDILQDKFQRVLKFEKSHNFSVMR